jgi:putative Mg2+ transporter-C (MgtC) family protein
VAGAVRLREGFREGPGMLSATTYGEMALRLLATLLLCGLIGLQRALAGKAAGVRTHSLVGLGSCAMTLVSAYAFPSRPGVPLDPTRLAAQTVLGIGFIGGGAILKEGVGVRVPTCGSYPPASAPSRAPGTCHRDRVLTADLNCAQPTMARVAPLAG